MNKLIAAILLSIYSVVVWSEIQVQIEPSQVSMGQTFTLTITQENQQNRGVPDLSSLQQDFIILGTERQVNYSIINGVAQSASQWVVTLRPLKSGILTIPAIKFGSELSNPLTINVQATSNVSNDQLDPSQQQDVRLVTQVDNKQPHVNQQILYTVKIYFNASKRLLDADFQGPQVNDALLVPLGDARRYQEVQNGINYVVEEQSYAIFPQKSGTLDIVSPTFTGLLYDFDPQRINTRDKTISLTVQPVPKQYQGKAWLPAKQINLTSEYEDSKHTLSQGSTLIRTVKIEGVGVPAQLLPKLEFAETDAFNVYPEKGTDRNEVKQGELVGSTEFKVTYLFNKPGKVVIPELRLPWFNSATGKQEVAILAPRSLEITPSAITKTEASNTDQNLGNIHAPSPDSAAQDSSTASKWPWLIAILFGLAWVATLLLWQWQKRPIHSNKGRYKQAIAELSKACSEGNPQKARDALLKWGSLHWPDAPLLNLTDLTKLVRDAHLKKQINALSQVLYRREERSMWRGDELIRAVNGIKKGGVNNKAKKSNTLPPINPF